MQDKSSRRNRETRASDSGPMDRRHSSPLLFTVRGTCIPVYPIQTAIFSSVLVDARRVPLIREDARIPFLRSPLSI